MTDADTAHGGEAEVSRVIARGHRLDGPSCTLLLIRHRGGEWTIYGLTRGEHPGADGVRLSAAEMSALCEAVLGRAQ